MAVTPLRRKGLPPQTRTVTLPAPTGGWNSRDSVESMPIGDAVSMTDCFPSTTSVVLRFGYTQFATDVGQNETLMNYASGTASKLFTIASGNIYDVSAGGAVGAAAVTGLSNSRFQYANLTNSGGSYLVAVNGLDKQQVFDGTTWTHDGDGSHDISGVDSSTLVCVNTFKSRLWYTQVNTLKAWYLAVNAISGAATALDLSGVFQMGGYLMCMGTWTIDAGYGVDDYAVWVTSVGEIAVYRLTDPTAPTGIALVGIWRLGAPIGRRCFMKYGGDLLLICQDGLLPLSGALQSSRLNPRVSLTDKITFAVSAAISSYGANFGWQTVYFAKENQLYLNVPIQAGTSQQQYVMNSINKSWCNFTGYAANCWEIFNENLYFGGNNYVGKAWNTLADNGAAITGITLQAFSSMGVPQNKRFTMLRPYLMTSGNPMLFGAINTDFDTSVVVSALSVVPVPYALWDSATWDSSIWGQDLVTQGVWQGANSIGYYGAPQLKMSANGIQVQWASTTVSFETSKGVQF